MLQAASRIDMPLCGGRKDDLGVGTTQAELFA